LTSSPLQDSIHKQPILPTSFPFKLPKKKSQFPKTLQLIQIKMSFLIEFRQIAPRIAARTSFAPRALSTSPTFRKIVPEAVKNATKTVDRAVSDKLVDGIEIGRMFALLFPPFCILMGDGG
jgi:hypothetical protein